MNGNGNDWLEETDDDKGDKGDKGKGKSDEEEFKDFSEDTSAFDEGADQYSEDAAVDNSDLENIF